MTNIPSPTVSPPSIDAYQQTLHLVANAPRRPIALEKMEDDPLDELLADIIEMLLCADENDVDD